MDDKIIHLTYGAMEIVATITENDGLSLKISDATNYGYGRADYATKNRGIASVVFDEDNRITSLVLSNEYNRSLSLGIVYFTMEQLQFVNTKINLLRHFLSQNADLLSSSTKRSRQLAIR